jgi:hypothetical protein
MSDSAVRARIVSAEAVFLALVERPPWLLSVAISSIPLSPSPGVSADRGCADEGIEDDDEDPHQFNEAKKLSKGLESLMSEIQRPNGIWLKRGNYPKF